MLGAGTVLLASIALILAGTRGTGSETGRQPTSRGTGAATTRVSGAEGGRATPVPILMYHVIADPAASAPPSSHER